MGLCDPGRSPAADAARDEILSHINVARMILSTRLDQGLTQEELGRAAGTKQSRISEIEALKGNPRFDTLDRIAKVLGLMIALVPRGERPPVKVEPPQVYQMSLWGEVTWEGTFTATSNHMSGAHG